MDWGVVGGLIKGIYELGELRFIVDNFYRQTRYFFLSTFNFQLLTLRTL